MIKGIEMNIFFSLLICIPLALAQQKDPEVLDKAIIFTDLKTVKHVIDNGAFISTRHMAIAISRGKTDVVKLFLEKVPSLIYVKDEYKRTPLHMAAADGYIDIASLLISFGADLNAKDKKGQSPLYYAIKKKKPDVANLLIEKGSDVNAKDNEGRSPAQFILELTDISLFCNALFDYSNDKEFFCEISPEDKEINCNHTDSILCFKRAFFLLP